MNRVPGLRPVTARSVPLVILGGSDLKPGTLPGPGRDEHALAGYKGMEIRIRDRPMVSLLIERLAQTGRFAPIYVFGPAAVYSGLGELAQVIDADGTFGRNIEDAVKYVTGDQGPGPIGFIACDVLPEAATLETLMAHYDSVDPSDLWFPLVRVPEDRNRLGASAWKPAYRVVPEPGEAPVRVLPGHLVVVDPAALRLDLIYRLMQLGYRTRNRSITYRRRVMVRGVVLELLFQDLLHLIRLRLPTLTWTVLITGISAARRLRAGTITRRGLEDATRKLMVTARHRRRHPSRRVELPIVDALSLALDIDTEEEARQAGGQIGVRSA